MSFENASIFSFSISASLAFLSIRENFEVNHLFAFGSIFFMLWAIYFGVIGHKS
jgi:hypothetical protein